MQVNASGCERTSKDDIDLRFPRARQQKTAFEYRPANHYTCPRKRSQPPAPCMTLPRRFYHRPTLEVARDLIGKVLVRETPFGVMSGAIVETEAYIGEEDPACHAFHGLTPRTRVMYGPAGRAYVYFTYGNHFMLNVVTEEIGRPAAVLIRALEPIHGIQLMKNHRDTDSLVSLTSGPGKLCKAFAITAELNGVDLVRSRDLHIEHGRKQPAHFEIRTSSRIGIRAGIEPQWRFFIDGNPYVSRTKPPKIP